MATQELEVTGSYRDDPLTAVEEWVWMLNLKFGMFDHKRGSGVEKIFFEVGGDPAQIQTLISELRAEGLQVDE